MRRALAPLFLFTASSLFAFQLYPTGPEVVPPAPDSHTHIRVRFRANNCVPVTHASVTGLLIKLTSTQAFGGCIATFVPATAVADVGVLPPGIYSIQTESGEHGSLVVRDADSGIVVSPVGVSSAGGRQVQVFSDPYVFPVTVLFDGIPATIESSKQKSLTQYTVVTPPPHAPGTVDVNVVGSDGSTRKAVAAFTYFDPSAPPDPSVFEPVLFPVAYAGAGEFGSRWNTENVIGTGETLLRFREPLLVNFCTGACGKFSWSGFVQGQSPSGVLIWTVRRRVPAGVDAQDEFRVSSRIFESSHPESGIALPVVRERDFRNSMVFDNVPLGDAVRVTVRIYSLDAPAAIQAPVIVARGGVETVHPVVLELVNGVAFGAIDIPAGGQPRTQMAKITVRIGPPVTGWALLTVTDNVTQQVTAYWPQ